MRVAVAPIVASRATHRPERNSSIACRLIATCGDRFDVASFPKGVIRATAIALSPERYILLLANYDEVGL
jgi:hypothetical protein